MSSIESTAGQKPTRLEQVTLEAWSQGFMVGALLIMAAITVANMRSGVLLHKLILVEVGVMPHLSTGLSGLTSWPPLLTMLRGM
jgi:uncharacterized YccA/Bax inhibitor family protein